jgi:hypothetical protein
MQEGVQGFHSHEARQIRLLQSVVGFACASTGNNLKIAF